MTTHHHVLSAPLTHDASAPISDASLILQNHYDQHMTRLYPDHEPTSQEILRLVCYAMGATNDTLQEHLDILNRKWDSIFEHYPGGKPPTLGEKPQPNDPNVLYIKIPNMNLSIRFWPGGMEQYGQCCFDFFNPTEHTTVNTPYGFVIIPLPQPGMIPFEGRLKSWEEAMQVGNIMEGMEKYSAPEGMRLILTYPGDAPFYFQVPSRPAIGFAQAQASILPM